MFRRTAWRNTVSDAVSLHQDQALNATIFLLKAFGPTGFLLREEGEERDFKVCLGDRHACSCPVFTGEREPCKHICWILLRKFRLPRDHEYSFQHGLGERQILEVLHGLHQAKAHRMGNDPSDTSGPPSQPVMGQESGSVCRKAIQAGDVCPICQEELLEKKLPVSFCRFGCGNNVHVSCMKVWADHQRLSGREETVRCPLCREDFSSLKSLLERVKNSAALFTAAERAKQDRHLGLLCHGCRVGPIAGKCFKCTVCSYVYLCEDCTTKGCHSQHPLASRTKRSEKWHLVVDTLSDDLRGATSPPASDRIPVAADPIPEDVLEGLPVLRVRPGSRLLDDGQQCRICLQDFSLGQRVRSLPCHHKFHTDCVDGMLRKSNSCPLDGYVIYNPQSRRTSDRKTSSKLTSCPLSDFTKHPGENLKDLFVPGVALQRRDTKVSPSNGSLNLEVLTEPAAFQDLCIATTHTKEKQREQSSSFEPISKSDSGAHSRTKCVPASPNRCFAETRIREQPQLNLFVGLRSPESDQSAAAASPASRTRLTPKRRGMGTVTDANNRVTPELKMTGVLINTKLQR